MSSQPSPTALPRHSASVAGAVDSAAAGEAGSAPAQTPLRVLIVTPRYLPEIGGVENHVHAVATRMAASGEASVTVLTTDLSGDLASHDRDGDADVLRVRAYPRSRDWRYAPGIARVLRGGDWDVVHLQSYHTFVAPQAMAAAARARIPYVVTFHGGGHSDWLRHRVRGLQRALLRPLLARAAALIATARFEIEEYATALRIPIARFVLIPNGFDLPPPPARGIEESPRGRPLIASLGRLERYKGHQRVIAALPAVRVAEPAARLWVAGSGPYEAALRKQVSELGLDDAVEISSVPLGERAEMARRLSEVDLAVALSEFETHPMAALEVLSLQRPLLVATGSGLGELADRGYARAIDPHATPEEVAAAILRELRDPLVPARAEFPSWDDCAAELLALYHRVRSPA
jgi:glycosyltransferase involved in cell wall biosynthesis